MQLVLGDMPSSGDALPVEVVERKGRGHPDTISDALAEAVSLRLSRHYREHFGTVLHHNVDKVLLVGGASTPAFGGGRLTAPIEVFLSGRATSAFHGKDIPVAELASGACLRWFAEHLPGLDAGRDLRVHTLIRPGSSELVDLFLRPRAGGAWLANDTSIGVGYAPLSRLERAVLAVETRLNAGATKRACPAIGTDVKVLGVRHEDRVAFTVATAMVDRHVADLAAYRAAVSAAATEARTAAAEVLGWEPGVVVNAADDIDRGQIYLTVTGTSAEAGDDGEAGRGNRVNGLITPFRLMTMESVAGKNPVTHVGKLYNLAAALLSEAIVEETDGVLGATCVMVSRIGAPVTEPQLIEVRIQTDGRPQADVLGAVERIAADHLQRIPRLVDDLLDGSLAFDRWPLRGTARIA